MDHPEYRKLRFDLDHTVPFQWNPEHPIFGLWGNAVSFLAVGWEKYILSAVRDVLDDIDDPDVHQEAKIFIAQEAQHAAAHRLHLRGLITRYPGLQNVLDDTHKHFDDLYATKSTKFHLAYMAGLEATFPSLFRSLIDHRERLFADGDTRVASVLLWHCIEEIEHRSSAIAIYDEVFDDPWYRLRVAPVAFGHFAALFRLVAAGFAEHVPAEELGAPAESIRFGQAVHKGTAITDSGPQAHRLRPHICRRCFTACPRVTSLAITTQVLRSQTPRHDPATERIPDWFHTWTTAYDSGRGHGPLLRPPP